uniref:Uncharacterized protein n=1 Tax=Arundo donax TaxID=35708 RepID=A0A0A8ZT38_ARUDO
MTTKSRKLSCILKTSFTI